MSAWNGLLLAEWFGATSGVGWRARYWYDANQLDGFLAWVLLFIAFLIIVDQVILGSVGESCNPLAPSLIRHYSTPSKGLHHGLHRHRRARSRPTTTIAATRPACSTASTSPSPASTFVSIVGPSGSGKSTLLNIVAGIESHSGGSVALHRRSTERRRWATSSRTRGCCRGAP